MSQRIVARRAGKPARESRRQLEEHYQRGGREALVSTSIGIATFPADGQDAGRVPVPVAVNLSARQFGEPGLGRMIQNLSAAAGIDTRPLDAGSIAPWQALQVAHSAEEAVQHAAPTPAPGA